MKALPTASEMEILRVIWDRGPSTVREVYNTLSAEREIGYSTVLKFMQIMTRKGSLARDERVRPQIYWAPQARESTQRSIIRDLLRRVFGGSPASMVMQVLSDQRAGPKDRQRIRQFLDELDRKKGVTP